LKWGLFYKKSFYLSVKKNLLSAPTRYVVSWIKKDGIEVMSKNIDEQVNATKNPSTKPTPETNKSIKISPVPKKGQLPSLKWLETIADFIYDLFT
jgi:hypothetical protein